MRAFRSSLEPKSQVLKCKFAQSTWISSMAPPLCVSNPKHMSALSLTVWWETPPCLHAAMKWRQHGPLYRASLTNGKTNHVRPSRPMKLAPGVHKPRMSTSGKTVVAGDVPNSYHFFFIFVNLVIELIPENIAVLVDEGIRMTQEATNSLGPR